MASLDGKTAIIFGGIGGIGQACTEVILKNGVKVLCCDIDVSDAIAKWQDTYGRDKIVFKKCDVTKTEEVNGMFECCKSEFGSPAEIIINTVGIIDEFAWEKCVDVNLGGSIRILQSTLQNLGKHNGGNGGVIILISSILGLGPGANVPVYTATKHGIIGLARSWAQPLHHSEHGVRINVVCPTVVDTPLLQYSLDGKMHKSEMMAQVFESLGGKAGVLSPDTIAEEVLTLVEDDTAHDRVVRVSKMKGNETVEFDDQPHV